MSENDELFALLACPGLTFGIVWRRLGRSDEVRIRQCRLIGILATLGLDISRLLTLGRHELNDFRFFAGHGIGRFRLFARRNLGGFGSFARYGFSGFQPFARHQLDGFLRFGRLRFGTVLLVCTRHRHCRKEQEKQNVAECHRAKHAYTITNQKTRPAGLCSQKDLKNLGQPQLFWKDGKIWDSHNFFGKMAVRIKVVGVPVASPSRSYVQLAFVMPRLARGETEDIQLLIFEPFDSFLGVVAQWRRIAPGGGIVKC